MQFPWPLQKPIKKNEDSIVGLVSIFPHKHVLKVMKMYHEYKWNSCLNIHFSLIDLATLCVHPYLKITWFFEVMTSDKNHDIESHIVCCILGGPTNIHVIATPFVKDHEILWNIIRLPYLSIYRPAGPCCSKLTPLLVNVLLNF